MMCPADKRDLNDVNIDADKPSEKLEETVQLGPTYSAVLDPLIRTAPVKVQSDETLVGYHETSTVSDGCG